jgi:hypothetical protein
MSKCSAGELGCIAPVAIYPHKLPLLLYEGGKIMQFPIDKNSLGRFMALLTVVTLAGITQAQAGETNIQLVSLDGSAATGQVTLHSGNRKTTVSLKVSGLKPNAVHSVWLMLDATASPFLIDPVLGLTVMTDANLGTLTPVFPVSPAAADNSGFKAGTGLDPNGFVSSASGSASLTLQLNYDLTQPASAPVVLVPQGENVQVAPVTGAGVCTSSPGSSFTAFVDSGYARLYDTSSATPSFQLHDGKDRAKLIRGTVAAIIVVEHLDGLTHGHAPGVMVEATGCGDHLGKLIGTLQ